jgi:hypothetical protein
MVNRFDGVCIIGRQKEQARRKAGLDGVGLASAFEVKATFLGVGVLSPAAAARLNIAT